jgi:phosphoglycerate dehydrogenase-like enzyme
VRLVFCGTGWLSIVDRIRARLPAGATIRVRDYDRPIAHEVRDAHVIIPSNAWIGAAEIDAARDLRLIQQPAAGWDVVDIDAARAHGVPVCNAPGKNAQAVAEGALLLMLALARRLPEARQSFAERRIGDPVGFELAGRTLGIVGMGHSGTRLAAIAEGLGMHVLSVRSESGPSALARLLERSDVISLHVPLEDRTRGLIDAAAFARMKPGALLVNCARGGIVDRAALVAALDSGHLGGAGLDVHWAEPADPADPLYTRANVVALPHVAGSTIEAFDGLVDVIIENVARVARGEEPIHRVA